jgi:hypothetical protein
LRSHSRRWGIAHPASSSLWLRASNRVRILGKDIIDAAHGARGSRAGVSIQERQKLLAEFYEAYEDFVEMLCDAAQYGPTPRLENGYRARRAQLAASYLDLKPLLSAFIRTDAAGAHDAFEALFSTPTVSEFLQSDDGETITRITRAREALNLYAEHLRHLAERTG